MGTKRIILIEPDKAVDFTSYQHETAKSAQAVAGMGHPIIYPTMGLANEAGELAGKVKKIFRDDGGVITPDHIRAIKKEAGDVLWYLGQVCYQLNIDLGDVARDNARKLRARQENDTINGEGDER